MLALWHFWTAFFATAGMLLLAAYLGSRRRRLTPIEVHEDATGAPMGCGRCGYDVRGLPSRICPECGSDLDVVGRITPRFRRWQRVPPLGRAALWTLLVVGIGGALTMLAIHRYALVQIGYYEDHSFDVAIGLNHEMDISIRRTVSRWVWLEGEKWPLSLYNLRHEPPDRSRVEMRYVEYRGEKPTWPATGGRKRYVSPKSVAFELVRVGNSWIHAEQLGSDSKFDPIGRMYDLCIEAEVPEDPELSLEEASYILSSHLTGSRTIPTRLEGTGYNYPSIHRGFAVGTAGTWLLVWLAGLPLVMRRRAIKTRQDPRVAK